MHACLTKDYMQMDKSGDKRLITELTRSCYINKDMLPLELYSLVLEIPNDAYTTLIQHLIGCSTFCQDYGKLIGL